MTIITRRFLYTINVLTIFYLVFAVCFSANSITAFYKKLSEINYQVEIKYREVLNKYKETIVFILKNDLPQNLDYFNALSAVAYDLPLISEFKNGEMKDIITSDDGYIVECYNGKCINLLVAKEKIFNKIVEEGLWKYGVIETIPIKKTTLFKISINRFLKYYKNFIISTSLYFIIFFMLQFLFIMNYKLAKTHASLLTTLDKYNKLGNSVLFIQKLVNEYFTHYIHQLLTRDVCIETVDLIDILSRIENFLNYQITKRELKIILNCEDGAKNIRADNEIIFIVLLNLIFKAIFRSKIAAVITVNIFQISQAVKIEISDTGYEYSPKLNSKIEICELPSPVLKKLCQKVDIEVEEIRQNETNIVFIEISSKAEMHRSNGNIMN